MPAAQHATHATKGSGRASMLTRCTQQSFCVLRTGSAPLPGDCGQNFGPGDSSSRNKHGRRAARLYASGPGSALAPASRGTDSEFALDPTNKKLAYASREAASWQSILSSGVRILKHYHAQETQDDRGSREATKRRISGQSARIGHDSKRKDANEFLPHHHYHQNFVTVIIQLQGYLIGR